MRKVEMNGIIRGLTLIDGEKSEGRKDTNCASVQTRTRVGKRRRRRSEKSHEPRSELVVSSVSLMKHTVFAGQPGRCRYSVLANYRG